MAIFNTVYGGEWKWHPWSNTLAYYPFKWDLENKVNWALATLGSWSSIWSNYATANASIITCPLPETINPNWTPFTFSTWCNPYQYPGSYWNPRMFNDSVSTSMLFTLTIKKSDSSVILNWSSDENASYRWMLKGVNTRNNIIVSYPWTGNTTYVYINGTKYTYTNGFEHLNAVSSIELWCGRSPDQWYWYFADVILEKSNWTDDKATKYYDSTKSNYS